MVQPAERMTARLTVHIYPSVKARLDRVVAASPFDLPDWIRHFIDETLVRLELEDLAGSGAPEEAFSVTRPSRCSSRRPRRSSRGKNRSLRCYGNGWDFRTPRTSR